MDTEFWKYNKRTAIIHITGFRTFGYSYSQLHSYVHKTRSYLRRKGLRKGDKVIICGIKRPEWAVLFIACLYEGIIVVPLQEHISSITVSKIKNQVKPKFSFCDRYAPINGEHIEDLFLMVEKEEKCKDGRKAKDSDIAEIIYTSGTTGKPKGVILTHGNIQSNLNDLKKAMDFPLEATVISILPLSHMFGQVGGLFLPLKNFATIIYMDVIKPTTFIKTARKHKADALILVPRMLESLKEMLEKLPRVGFIIRKILGNPKYIIVGGAPLSLELENFFENLGFIVLQGYGLTESSPVVSCNTQKAHMPGSVGKPLKSVTVKIAKDKEILVKGPNVFKGYFKNNEETRKALRKGWLHTGDLGKIDNGFLYVTGRKKEMIVTPEGENVFPQDIEEIFAKKFYAASCVVGKKTQRGEKIVAVVLNEKNLSRLQSKINQVLPHSHQIQETYEWPGIDFPRTQTQKIRRFMVEEWVNRQKTVKESEEDPLLRIIQNYTSKKVGEENTFSGLGLSSIDRLEIISLLEQEYHKDIDDTKITKETRIKDLRKYAIQKHRKKLLHLDQLLGALPISWVREFAHEMIFLTVRSISEPKVSGINNIPESPFILIANHTSHLDTPAILSVLSYRVRKKTSIAAMAEYFEKGNALSRLWKYFLYIAGSLFLRIFLLPTTTSAREEFAYIGELISKGQNVLIFPEGQRNRKIGKFKPGIGLLASEMRVPIVPARVRGCYDILPPGRWKPKKGRIQVTFGKPLMFKPSASYVEITKKIREAVKSL